MGKKRRILFAVLVLAILGGLAWMVFSPRVEPEPVYQGKSLSVWLENYDPYNTKRSSQQSIATQTAIQTMGTNAIPTMLRMLRTPNLPWKNWLFALAQKQHVIKIKYVEPWRNYERAAYGLQALGPRAADAVPELLKMFDQYPGAQMALARDIAYIGPDAKMAVPSLLRHTTSKDSDTRANSLYALGQIHAEPDLTVPVLINGLQDPDPGVGASAAMGLGAFGPKAKAAVPALVKFIESKAPPTTTNNAALSSWWLYVKGTALQSLQQIDPEAAAKVAANVYPIVK